MGLDVQTDTDSEADNLVPVHGGFERTMRETIWKSFALLAIAILLSPHSCHRSSHTPSSNRPTKQPGFHSQRVEQRMGVYLKNRRIGSSFLQLETLSPSDPDPQQAFFYRFREESSLEELTITLTAQLRADFSLGRFEFLSEGAEPATARFLCHGEVKGTNLEIAVETAGVTRTQSLLLTEPCYLASAAHFPICLKAWTPGAEYPLQVFDPLSQDLGPMVVKIGQRSQKKALGRPQEATEIHLTYQGVEQTSWITDDGLRLEDVALGGAIVAKLETEQASQHTPLGTAALMEWLADEYKIDVEGRIPRPRQCRRLVIELTGIASESVPVDGFWQRQRARREKDTPTFQIEIGRNPAFTGIEAGTDALASTLLIQSDAEVIRKTAEELIQGASSDREKTARLCHGVFVRLDRSAFRATIPSAVEVLQSGKGDCNEHAVLFAALARAVGVPTRVCAGVVYFQGAFHYHAWNEVFLLGSGWTPVDTTLDQLPADATHLKLAEGGLSNQAQVLNTFGKLRAKIVQVEYEE